jgi:hypothetical protein
LSSEEKSEGVCSSVPNEHSNPCDRAQASDQGDVTPKSVESHATLRNTEDFVDVGHLGSGVSVSEAHDQVQSERGKASVKSSSLIQAVQDRNLWIDTKLREFQVMSEELEDALHMMKGQKGTAIEKARIQRKKISDSRIDRCKRAGSENNKPTVYKSQINRHFDAKKTKFDASKLQKMSTACVSECWAPKLQSMCLEMQVMCESVSSVLPSTLESFLLGGIICPKYARPYIHLAEISSLLIGFSSKLSSAVGHIMNNVSDSNAREMAHLIFAIKELNIIFPLLETKCRNLYSLYLQDHSSCDRHADTDKNKGWHAQARSKMDTISHQMDVAYEQLEKAILKMNTIRDKGAASSEIPLCPLRPETDSEQPDPKQMLIIIAKKILIIQKHISFLIEVRRFQGQAE